MTTLLERAVAFEPELIELRRDLHRHPELSFQEVRTAGRAAELVGGFGFSVRTGVALTGVVAELVNGPGPCVALRADMDALPIRETNDVPYRSTVDGVMHACGHDGHVTMLVGAARLLAEAHGRGELPGGAVRLLFQPSEERADRENKSGAQRMIEEGAMLGVDAVFGAHLGGHLPTGLVYLRSGPIMSGSDVFGASVYGRGAHAGRPHEGVDAIVLAAHVVLACQNAVARRLGPLDQGVLTIGTVRGGTAENVLCDAVHMRGTVRYFEDRVRGMLHRELRNAFAVAEALGGRTKIDVLSGYPPVENDARLTDIAHDAVTAALGADAVAGLEPIMYAEDFSLLARAAPGCFLWIGAAPGSPREHHTSTFDFDEHVLARGAAALAACAMHALERLR